MKCIGKQRHEATASRLLIAAVTWLVDIVKYGLQSPQTFFAPSTDDSPALFLTTNRVGEKETFFPFLDRAISKAWSSRKCGQCA